MAEMIRLTNAASGLEIAINASNVDIVWVEAQGSREPRTWVGMASGRNLHVEGTYAYVSGAVEAALDREAGRA